MVARPEIALWRAVIAQAIKDARSRPAQSPPDPEIESVHNWIEHGGVSFETVCGLADLDPGHVRRVTFSNPQAKAT